MIQDWYVKYYDYRPFRNTFLNKVSGRITKELRQLANWYLPKYFQRHHISLERLKDLPHSDAIVCMTTFPKRFPYLWLVIECLLRQTMLPKQIVLYLSLDQFPNKQIPDSLKYYIENDLLQIRWVDGDIRSHKKYWYAVTEFPHTPIITADDDLIYPSSHIEMLTKAAHMNPQTTPCAYWHWMSYDNSGEVLPYSRWRWNCPGGGNKMMNDAFFGSGGGVYFPAGSLQDANQPIEIIKETCPLADDIWLNAIIRKNGYTPYALPYKYSVLEWTIKENVKLATINNGQKQNDKQLELVNNKMEQLFGIKPFQK